VDFFSSAPHGTPTERLGGELSAINIALLWSEENDFASGSKAYRTLFESLVRVNSWIGNPKGTQSTKLLERDPDDKTDANDLLRC
jgi:hypothetical protein